MKMKWISVKDALPKESMEVIVHVDFEESGMTLMHFLAKSIKDLSHQTGDQSLQMECTQV